MQSSPSRLTLALLLALAAGRAGAAGNAAAGAMVFEEECAECHTTSGRNKKGPTLKGIVGRRAGTAAGYTEYSDAVKTSKLVWTSEELDRYLKKPSQFLPKVRMKYGGLADDQARADLIAFLATKK